jgi:hypothetical protein
MKDKKASRRKAAAKMLMEKAKTFEGKVKFVKKKIPNIKDPEAFVAASLREAGEIE